MEKLQKKIDELNKAVEALTKRISELEARPAVHNHYHYVSTPLQQWPLLPQVTWCQGIGIGPSGIGGTDMCQANKDA